MALIVESREEFIVGGRYQLKRKIGSGSFGEIFLALDIQKNIEYAVKIEPVRVSFFYCFFLYSLH